MERKAFYLCIAINLLLVVCFAGNGGAAFYNDPYHVPMTPTDDYWFLYQYKTARELQDEIAVAVDPANGEKAEAVRNHLDNGGRVVVLVGGYGSWGSPASWMRPVISYANGSLDAVCIQVNYQDWRSADYMHSFSRGVDFVFKMVMKARYAGAAKVRIYGHSEGGDITGRVVAIMVSSLSDRINGLPGQANPDWFEGGFGYGVPAGLGIFGVTVTSSVAPPPDQEGRRGGFYRYDWGYNGYWYLGKFVLFNRWSDPATYGGWVDIARWGTSNHDYTGVFSYPDFVAEFEAVLDRSQRPTNNFDPAFGYAAYVDRGAGEGYDFTSVHFLPYVPSSSEVTRCVVTVANASQGRSGYYLTRFFNSYGSFQNEDMVLLGPNASHDVSCPPMWTAGNAVIFATEPMTAVISADYDNGRNDAGRIHYEASYPSEAFPSREIQIPFLAKGWIYGLNSWRQSTELVLFNPSSEYTTATITYYDSSECASNPSACRVPQTAQVSRWIPPFGSVRLPSGGSGDSTLPSGWASSRGWGVLASATVRSDLPLVAMVTNRGGAVGNLTGTVYQEWTESNYRAFTTRGAQKVYLPLIKKGTINKYQTGFIVHNPGELGLAFVIKYYRSDGGIISTTPEYTLYPHAMKGFGAPAELEGDGNAVIEVTYPRSEATVVAITQIAGLNGLEMTEGIPDGAGWYQERPDLVHLFLLKAEPVRYDTEINVVNRSSTWENVTFNYYNESGAYTGVFGGRVLTSWSSIHFSLANMNFKGTGTVVGSNNKRLGAAVQINRQDIPIGRDAFKGYSAWW
jgi:hypothetical protein